MSNEKNPKQDLSKLFQLIKDSLSDNSANFVSEFIDVGEWGIALESIYDYLDDDEVLISRDAYNLIQSLASSMKMDTRDWHSLEIERTETN